MHEMLGRQPAGHVLLPAAPACPGPDDLPRTRAKSSDREAGFRGLVHARSGSFRYFEAMV